MWAVQGVWPSTFCVYYSVNIQMCLTLGFRPGLHVNLG